MPNLVILGMQATFNNFSPWAGVHSSRYACIAINHLRLRLIDLFDMHPSKNYVIPYIHRHGRSQHAGFQGARPPACILPHTEQAGSPYYIGDIYDRLTSTTLHKQEINVSYTIALIVVVVFLPVLMRSQQSSSCCSVHEQYREHISTMALYAILGRLHESDLLPTQA